MRFLAIFHALLLLCALGGRDVEALRVASASLTNATAHTPTELRVVVDWEGASVPADAVFTLTRHPQLTNDGDALTCVDTALLATQLDGELQVAVVDANGLTISRGAGASETTLSDNTLSFRFTQVTTPRVAGAISLGSLSVGDAADAAALGVLTLPSVDITPGRLWDAQVTFSNLLSGRVSPLDISFTPGGAVPANGSILVHLPRLYSASSAVLSGITLANTTNIDGELHINVVDTALRFSWGSDTVGGIDAGQAVVLQLEGFRHPLLEGPVGRAVRVETTDADNNVIDQAAIDVSGLTLDQPSVQLSKSRLYLNEASSGGDTYTIALSAPPEFSPGISISIAARLSDSVTAASSLIIEPSCVVFSASNWSSAVNVTVRTTDDDVAMPTSSYYVLSHTIEQAASETSFAAVDDIAVFVEDDDLPLVHLSSRYLAVAETLRNDSYNISLLARPSSDVTVAITSPSTLINIVPSTVTFTASSWATIQTVLVQANPAGSSPSSAVRTLLSHLVSSNDTTFRMVVPQASVQVYYEPFVMQSCVEPCRPGWYPMVNSTTNLSQCIACPLGYYCPGACTLPIGCAAGTYSNTSGATSSSVCVDCPVGSFANDIGRSSCVVCPAGTACPRKDASFEPCPVGTFALEGQGSCRPCPAGTYSNSTSRERCEPCPVDSYCAGGTVLPRTCANGTYSVESGARPCESCPAGYACSNSTTLTPTRCPDGSYALAGDVQCRVCPQGYYCPSAALAPIKCGQGTYSHAGQTNCTVCPLGYTCTFPDLPKSCAIGEVSNGNHSACINCPPGYACPVAAATPVQCAAGTFSTGGAMVCTPCAAGYACPDTTSTQRIPCLAGTYSTGGAASCTPCPAGYACPTNNSATFTPCPTGWYSQQGSAACTECPRGYYCDVPYELPKNCTLGSYSAKASTSCVPCDPGYECPRSDQLPQPCPVGYYSGGAVANCKACRPGYKCGLASTSPTPPEDACPMGGYCNPPTTFFLCPAGTYGNVTAGESVDQACAPCPEGYFCEMGSTPLTKQSCPAGYACPIGMKRGSQFPCPAGTYSPLPNQASLDVCKLCPAGSFCVQGSANPVVCPQGYYCPEGTMAANQYPCPAGTYSGPRTGLTIASQCQSCELGSYCPEASSSPTSCPAGTYNPSTGSAKMRECLDCPPGWACPSVGQYEYVDRCAKGHFCPSGTVSATANPCPAGTYTERIDLIRAEDCTICPLRHACPEGTGGETQTMLDCGAGFFCPNGTAYAKQFPCPPGYWSSSTALSNASECDICPVGQYCSGGKSYIDGPCSAGYYCPLGTPSPTKFPCPSGTYTSKTWLFEPSQCDDCPPGYYCPAGSVAPIPCKPGSYSSFNNTKTVGPGVAWPDCVTCPAGYYCTEAAVVPAPCGKGNYSMRGSKSCSKCEAGYFCNSNTTSDTNMRTDVVSWLAPGSLFGKCYNGTYCPPGSDHEPALEIDACPRGYFCPKATPAPVICPAGTYSNLTGQDEMSDCIPTPAGYFSLEGSLRPTGPCDPGFYCPVRSTSRTQIPCPARYYQNRTGGQSEEDCAVCVAGSYCPRGSAYPVLCPTGSYCRTGVSSPEPCPIGTYSNGTGIKQVDDCLVCPPGMYCDSTGLTVPRGPCDPGYYCTLGSYTSAPMNYETTLFGVTNRNVGGQCPRGSFCPLGSAFPLPCPPGTYNNFTGLEMDTQCVQCPPGKYCDTPGLILPTGDCFSGYFCTGGAATPTQNSTPPGSYSGNGSTAPVPCPAGQFNTHANQEQCVDCPAGFFCGSPGTVAPSNCPVGHYCPKSTALPIKCPPGTLNDMEGIVSVLQCQSCPAGYFCDSFGLSAPSAKCLEGFVCSGGSPVSNPIAADYGYVCPAGHYCPAGSGAPTKCPRGSLRASTGGTSLDSCSLCPGGSYCGSNALTAPSGLCTQGYFCATNVSTATPSGSADDGGGGPCPKGSYCPEGSTQPQLCLEGTYSDQLRAATCTPCPAGYFCPLGSAGYESNPCPQGYYCPIGTKHGVQFPCLPGSFGSRTGLQDVSQCTPAPGGMYVEAPAAVAPTGYCKSGFYCSGGSATNTPTVATATGGPCLPGTNCPEGSAIPIVCAAGFYCSSSNTEKALPCDPGFYCVQGSSTANPTGATNALGLIGDVCTPGHYCPQGTSNPIPCPPGTFSETPQNHNETQCSPCSPGYICSVSGIVKPYEKCPDGFICTGGERGAAQRCPKGFECPLGSSEPKACPPGTFSDEEGLGLCKLCPARYFCTGGTITPAPCPAGYFCPLQTPTATKYPCPPGSFSNMTLLATSSECAPCSPGRFCSGAAPTDRVSGDCAPGYYCIGGASTATPTDGVKGDLCAGGFMCLGAAWLPNPMDGVTGSPCQPGFYCPPGSSAPVRCAKGSYNAFEKQATCTVCPAGGYCDTNATAPAPCPLRYYCPEGTVEPVLCPSGTYGHATSLESAAQCAPCSAGNFCVGGTLTASCSAGYYCKLYNVEPNPPLNFTAGSIANKSLGFDFGGPCPIGHYCPEGVLDPIPCPNSTARLDTHGSSVDDCGPCPAGMSCENGAFTVPCPAGYYCAQAQSAVPCPTGTYNPVDGQSKLSDCLACLPGKLCNSTAIVDLNELYDCPAGHYCPEASTVPVACPKGRFRRARGAASLDGCDLCTGGSYCEVATVEPTVCASRVYCPIESSEPLPCPGGSYCPYNSTVPIQCPAGFYCPMEIALPIECRRGFYCPAGSVAPLACPLGYIGRVTPLSGVLSRLSDACEPCPAGMFGIDPNRTVCETCLPGYVCLEGTRSNRPKTKDEDNGYPCPPGYYCPAGSSKELPCPSGSYQPNFQAANATDCRACPANSYQNNIGQASCLPCSKSAFAGVGATVCTCKGSHRAFQMTDGYCICEPGYEFYDQDMVLRSDEDDDVDCQPIVYDRCGSNQVRSDGGACVQATQTTCEKSCGNSTGTLVSSLGICQCDKQTDVDTVCDKKCRDAAKQLRVDPATGELQVYNPVTGSTESLADKASSLGIVSKVSCPSDGSSCQLHTVALSTGGFAGSYDVPSNVGAGTTSSSSSSTSAPASTQSPQRRLTGSTTTTIENPMVCLHVGEGIFFDLSTPGSYPIYLKDSMLNTNPTFDYGAFRALATKVKSNASTVAAFAFSFTEPGIYVFGNSLNGAAKTVITVMQSGTACPTEASIVPLSEKNLISVSVKRRTDDIILAPDWGLIIGLLGGLVGMVVAVIAGLYYFRTKSWATSSTRRRLLGYRATSKATDLATMHSKGVAVANKAATGTASASAAPQVSDSQLGTMTPAPVMILDDGKAPPLDSLSPRWSKNLMGHGDGGFHPDLARWEEEDLDLRELVDRLQQHHDAVTKCFDDQKGDVQSLLQHLQNEAAELKRLLVNALASNSAAHSISPPTVPSSVDALLPNALAAQRVPANTPVVSSAAPSTLPGYVPGVAPFPPLMFTPHAALPAQVSGVVTPFETSVIRAPTVTMPSIVPGAVSTSGTGVLDLLQSSVVQSSATPALPLRNTPVQKPLNPRTQIGAALLSPQDDLHALRLAAEAEAHAIVARQEEMRQQHGAMLREKFPQLTSDEVERLVDEFGGDLHKLVSSLNVEAQKAEEDIKTMLTARAVMADAHDRAMQSTAEDHKRVLEEEQQQRLTNLESKFAAEEDEIEQEYQRELERLEQEFAALGELDAGGDEALPESEDGDDEESVFDEGDGEGDEAVPDVDESGEEFDGDGEAGDGDGDANHDRSDRIDATLRSARVLRGGDAVVKPGDQSATPRATADTTTQPLRGRIIDQLRRRRAAPNTLPGAERSTEGSRDSGRVVVKAAASTDLAIAEAVETEIAKVQQVFASSLEDQARLLRLDADARKRALQDRIAARKQAAAMRLGQSGQTPGDLELEAEEKQVVEELERELQDGLVDLERRLGKHEKETLSKMEACAVDTADDVDRVLAACRAEHKRQAAALGKQLALERKREEDNLMQRLARRRQQRQGTSATQPDTAKDSEPTDQQEEREDDERERKEMEQAFAVRKEKAMRDLEAKQRERVVAALREHRNAAERDVAQGKNEVEAAEAELERIRAEHTREMGALQSSLQAERARQLEALHSRLASRKRDRLKEAEKDEDREAVAATMDSEARKEELELERDLTVHENETLAAKASEYQIQQRGALDRLLNAVGTASVALASRSAVSAAEQAEIDRVRAELDASERTARELEALEMDQRKKRLQDQIVQRRKLLLVPHDPSVSQSPRLVQADPVVVALAAEAMDAAIETQLERVRAQHDADARRLRESLLQDAELQKTRLRERLSRKQAALVALRDAGLSDGISSPRQLLGEERDREVALDTYVEEQLRKADARAAEVDTAFVEQAEAGAVDPIDELERLLSSCRSQYDQDAAALRERLARERREREQALQDRLAKRRAQRAAAIDTARHDAGIPITSAEEDAIAAKLRVAEEQEQAAMEEQLAADARASLRELHDQYSHVIQDTTQGIHDTASQRLGGAAADQERAAAELQRLMDEHDRERQALAAALDAERKTQQQSLRDKLAERRAQKLASVADPTVRQELIQQLDAQDVLEMAALDDQLDTRFEQAKHDARSRHAHEEATAFQVVNETIAKQAAADAARRAADAVRDAELRRLAGELEDALRNARGDLAHDASSRKARLAQRLQDKKNKKAKTTGLSDPAVGDVETIAHDPSVAAAAVIDDTIDEGLERIKRQHAESLERRVAELSDEAARRKALLRERIALKRKALALHDGLSSADKMEPDAAIREEETAGNTMIDTDLELKMRRVTDTITRHETQHETLLHAAADLNSDEVEKLLAACRRDHETELEAARRALEQERLRREQALQDRLARRREQKITEIMKQNSKSPVHELAELQFAAEAELAVEEDTELQLLDQQLTKEETARLAEVEADQQRRTAERLGQAEDQLKNRQARCQEALAVADDELRRVQDEHDRELAALRASLETERKRQEQKLQDNLAARRAQRVHQRGELSSEDAAALDVEDQLELVQLREELEQRIVKAIEETCREHEQQQEHLVSQRAKASAEAVAADAAVKALEAARQAEIDRIAAEFATSRERARREESDVAALQKAKIDARLAEKKRRKAQKSGMPDEGGPDPSVVVCDPLVAGTEALDGAVDDELERIRRQYQDGLQRRVAEIDAEAAARKAMLRARMDLKRKALAMRAAEAAPGAALDAIRAEEAALDEAQVAEEAVINADVEAQKRHTEQSALRDERAVQESLRLAAQVSGEELETLLEACKAAHEKDAAARRQALEQERLRHEMALRNRLAKRREQKIAETAKLLSGKPQDEQDAAMAALEKELGSEEKKELNVLAQALAQDEAHQVAQDEAARQRQVDELFDQADRAARDRHAQAHAAQAATEDELRRVRDEHERELAALQASLDAERRRQEQKLQDKLAARRAQRHAQGVSENALAVEEALELAELQDELQKRAARAVHEERMRQEDAEQHVARELAELSARAAVADAARTALEAARLAELARIAAEFEQGRRTAQEDEAADAQSRKAKLNDRLAQRRRREKPGKPEASSTRDSTPRVPVEEVVDTKAVVSATMEGAVDDELARIKRQYAESLQRRVAQIQDEADAKKAALKERIEQKRRALAMRGGTNAQRSEIPVEDEEHLQEEHAAAEATIDHELATKLQVAAHESEQQQRAAQDALQIASSASSDELEWLLEACQRAHASDAEALRRSLEQERQLQEQTLRDRLAKRRDQKLADARRQTQQAGASEAESDAARAAIEKELAADDERECALLAQTLAEEEARRLKEAEDAQQRQAAQMIQQAESQATARGEAARVAQAAAEDELRRVQQEHDRERAALQASLDAERKLQEQKLQDKLAARRAQRKHHQQPQQGQPVVEHDEHAIAAEEALERLQLESELARRAAALLEEERRRHDEQEAAIALYIAKAAAEASAADASKKAIEAARQAEIDRIAAEFEASRRRAMDDDAADAQSRRTKLDERLAQRRRREKKKAKTEASAPPLAKELMKAATKKLITVQRSLRSITENQAEKEIARLRDEHTAACQERFTAIEQDAALRKARLADRIAKKRSDARAAMTATKVGSAQHQEETETLERELAKELEAESRAIDESVAAEKQKIADEVQSAKAQVAAGLQAAAQRTAEEMEQLLHDCKNAHEEETKNLERALELERQRQEKALQDRIAKRKQQRQKAQELQQQQQQQPDEAASVVATVAAADEAADEREKRELEAQLEAKEAQVWEEMRRKQEEELLLLTKQAEAAALKKQEEAKLVQESAQVELDRLKREHEAEMATLTASLEAEQKRQQQQLQQRVAARRAKQQKQQKETEDAAENERLAKQLEEQEAADRRALEEQMQAELARRIEAERERQRQEEAELVARVAQANIDAAAADAARKAMDAARAVELERLAKEFDEKSRELRQAHMNDLLTQKQKLEARVAAKKQKKLMELEAKRELERQRLRELQEQEARAAAAEQERAQASVDDALAMAAAGGAVEGDGDASAPPPDDVEATGDTSPAPPAREETKRQLLEQDKQAVMAQEANHDAAVADRAAQQMRDIAAIQQLFDSQVIPLRMPLLTAVELVLSQRHQQETSLLLAALYQRKTQAIRDMLRDIMQQKAAAKALVMRSHPPEDQEQRLKELDEEYDERIRVAEQTTIQNHETRAANEVQQLKTQQLVELQFLLQYFSGAFAAAVERVQQQERERQAQADQAARLHGLLSTDASGALPVGSALLRPRLRVSLGTGDDDDMDDLVNELRARLQLEADERIQHLTADKHSELERLQAELDGELRRIGDDFDRLAEQERVAVEAAFVERVRGLAEGSRQRDVLLKEKDTQVASLLLMLRGRRAQQEARAKRLLATKLATVEQEFDRKIQIVTAKMLQKVVEEKELLTKKRKALAKATALGSARRDEEADTNVEESGTRSRARDDLNRSGENDALVSSDLREMIETRLTKIEGLIREQHTIPEPISATMAAAGAKTVPGPEFDEYKRSVAQAIDDVCRWHVAVHTDMLNKDEPLQPVPRDALDASTQTQVDFANTLVGMMEAQKINGETFVERVVVAESLPRHTETRDDKTSADDTDRSPSMSLTHFDPATRTLFVRAACFAQLTVGQLALLLVHGVATAQTKVHDVADPTFVGCVYRLLMQCYENLYHTAMAADDPSTAAAKTAPATQPSTTPRRASTSRADPSASMPRAGGDASGQWKSHVFELESFLSGFATSTPRSVVDQEASDTVSPSTPRLQRQASASMATRSALSLQRAMSSRLLQAAPSSAASTEMEALVVQERRQFLQEKLDTAEKLYAHVLRQYQEQKQSREYVDELLEQEKEASSSSLEDKAALLERLDELHGEAQALDHALDKTRKERDELFAQCQALRDELEQLPSSRPSTKAEAKS